MQLILKFFLGAALHLYINLHEIKLLLDMTMVIHSRGDSKNMVLKSHNADVLPGIICQLNAFNSLLGLEHHPVSQYQ